MIGDKYTWEGREIVGYREDVANGLNKYDYPITKPIQKFGILLQFVVILDTPYAIIQLEDGFVDMVVSRDIQLVKEDLLKDLH